MGILILFVTVSLLPQSRPPSNQFADLQISATKTEYSLGEPVKIERRFIKMGDAPVGFDGDDRQGRFRVFIAKAEDEFRYYRFKGWGQPGVRYSEGSGRYKTFDTIFFNSKPETDQLSEYGRRQMEKGMILTDYAFPEPGEYRIKATLGFSVRRGSDRFATTETVESNEISIRVIEPEGDDLRVWKDMNSDPRIGYFMMEGEAPIRYPSILDTVLAKVDKIVSEYPDSYLAGLMKEKAQEHRARRERYKREAERERLKREKEKAISASQKN
ncbi:MAG: hypothetical protein ABI791_13655 [Acidobacteriota bacterium]